MIELSINHFFVLSAIVFVIGLVGLALNHKNFINVLFCLEIIFIATNINFVATSIFYSDVAGQVFTVLILSVLAIELAIGLSIAHLMLSKSDSMEIKKL